MNNADFGKNMKNVRKYRNIKLVTTERRRNYFVSEPNYPTTKFFTETLSILDLSKSQMYKFWYDYVKPKYGENAKLRYIDIQSTNKLFM